jgi:hypothetical protein
MNPHLRRWQSRMSAATDALAASLEAELAATFRPLTDEQREAAEYHAAEYDWDRAAGREPDADEWFSSLDEDEVD